MTLAKLTAELLPTFTPSTQKDLKTAVKVLAHALKFPDPERCPLTACTLPLPALYRLVEQHLLAQGKGPHTCRNVKNNLSRLFRAGAQYHLLSLPAPEPVRRFNDRQRAPRPGSGVRRHDGTHLPYDRWPSPLKAEFAAFAKWATDPLVEGRDARWKKRPGTIKIYQNLFVGYFGFLYHIRHINTPTFQHLFDFPSVQAYIHWHINEKFKRPTTTSHMFISRLLAISRQYQPDPTFREQLKSLHRTIPQPPPVYHKDDAWVSLKELKQIGQLLWPSKPSPHTTSSRRQLALYAALSLMFQLWVYIPFRQRNMREMCLNTNLYRTDGLWRIRFVGEQLKIAVRQGQLNTVDFPFPDSLVPTLEQYLTIWRPLLTHGLHPPPPQLFLGLHGTPFPSKRLTQLTKGCVYRYTGKYWHPHIVRTVWATEYIRTTGDFYGAAVMLNDTLETVIKRYAHLREENVADTAYRWVQNRLTP